jgi:cytoskeletal protein CcmA (bactofilin family)
MFGENKDKLIKLIVEKSIIGEDFTVEGVVSSAGEVELGGTIKGPVNVKQLTIKEKGSVIGEINAEDVQVSGFVDGKITAQRIIIGATGKIKGNLEFEEIIKVEEGASLDGHLKKAPFNKIGNKVTNFINTATTVRKNLLKV